MLSRNPVPNLISGVSQQADSMKFPSQAVEQINADSNIVGGLTKRPPTNHVSRIVTGTAGNTLAHAIDRDVDNQFLAIFRNNAVQVFDTNGNQKAVNYVGAAIDYLATTTPQDDLKAISIADYTFVLNKTKIPAMLSATTAAQPNEGLIVIKQGGYAIRYSAWVDGVEHWFISDISGGTAHQDHINTHNIVRGLVLGATAAAVGGSSGVGAAVADGLGLNRLTSSGFTITYVASTIYITKATSFTLTVTDGVSNTYTGAIKGSVRNFTELPTVAPNGFKIKIDGYPEDTVDDYYVQFQTNINTVGSFEGGKWLEAVGFGVEYDLDDTKMPHILIHNQDDTFTFKAATWDNRTAGDADTNIDPSFVSHPINDIFFYKNRLGLLSEENVIFSESGQFFNFWRNSVTTILDSDPIDVAAAHSKVSILYSAVPFYDQLVLFGEKTQFSLRSSGDLLTSKTVSIQQTTEFENTNKCYPKMSGKNVYVGFNRGDFAGVWEYYVGENTLQFDAFDVTVGVPYYLQGDIVEMAICQNEKILVARTNESPNTLYIYRYYINGTEKVQSAWSKWELEPNAEIKNAIFLENRLFLVVYRPNDGLSIERIDVQYGMNDADAQYTMLLDRKVGETINGVYNSTTDTTTYYIPYSIPDTSIFKVVARFTATPPSGTKAGGTIIIPQSVGNDGVVVLNGNTLSQPLWFGINYTMTYQLSRAQMRGTGAAGSPSTMTVGKRYQLRKAVLVYSKSVYFKVVVSPTYRTASTHVYTGKNMGTGSAVINAQTVFDGSFSFPIMAQNTDVSVSIINEQPFPCSLTTLDWIGVFSPNTTRT